VSGTVPGAYANPDTPRISPCPPLPAGDNLDLAPPQTLHRLLGLRPDTEQAARHAGRPLELDLLVVDEASMVDLALMTRLLEALPPHARLLLLGDRDQLASVEAGAVLADLCPDTEGLPPALAEHLETLCGPEPPLPRWTGSPDLPTRACRMHLDHSHRFTPESPIGRATRALRDGDGATLLAVLQEDTRGTLRHLDSPRPERIPELLRSFLPDPDSLPLDNDDALLAVWESRQILCALNQGSQGMDTINRLAARRFCGNRWEDALHTGHPGMPLMILGNDTSRQLFNGDTGVFVAHGTTLEAVFRQGNTLRHLPAALLPRWQPAWAITVHKSQGSEYDEVLVLLPDTAHRLLGRELLYTALSRARRQLTLCATPDTVLAAAAASLRRPGGLRDALGNG
jgi:exodeoxyribonuclease V alpha subunit